MKSSNQIKGGIALSYVVMIVGYLISFIYTPILISKLGQSEYGNYNYVLSVVNYLSLFTCGFGSAYIRFYSRCKNKNDRDGVDRLNGMFMTLFMIMGLIALFVGLIMCIFSDNIFGGKLTVEELATTKILMIILVFNLFISFPTSVFKSFIIVKEQFIFQKIFVLIQNLLKPVIILPLVYMGQKSVGLAIGTTIIALIVSIADILFCVKKLNMRFKFGKFEKSLFKEIAIFSSFLLLSMIVDQINWSVDKFILGKFCGTILVSVYSVGAVLNTYYKQMAESISNVFVPRINRMVAGEATNHDISMFVAKIGRLQALVLFLVCSGFVIFGKTFIILWVGKEYIDSYYVALLLLIPITIPEIQKMALEVIIAKNLHKFRSVLYAIIAGVNIIITIPLCLRFGAVGSALGTALTVLLGNGLVINIYYYRKASIDIPYFWKEILRLSRGMVIPIFVGVVYSKLCSFGTSWRIFISSVLVYISVYFLSMWFFGMNGFEKEQITRLLRKIIRIKK